MIERETGNIVSREHIPFHTAHSLVVKDGVLHGIAEGHYFQWELDFYKFHMPWKPVLWSGGIVLLLGGIAGVFWNRHKNQRQQLALQRAELDAELKAAATVQKTLQPHTQGLGTNYWTLGETRAAWEVGGDFFAAAPMDQERLLLLLGDVAGHGLQAGVLVATVRGVLAAWWRNPERTVDELLKTLHMLTRMNGTRPRPLLATAALLVDLRSGEMECYLNGIPRPWILASDGQNRELEGPCGLPLGARKEANLRPFKACIQPGDRILMLSDGILEQFDSQERTFEGVGLKGLLDAARALKSPALFTDAKLIEAVQLANRTHLIPPQLESAVKLASMSDRESLGKLFQQVAVHAGVTKQADDHTILLMELVNEPTLSKLPKSFRIDLV